MNAKWLVSLACMAGVGLLLSGCTGVPTKPVEIGKDTYYLSATNVGGAFGDVGTLAQDLMQKASTFCAEKGLHLQVIEDSLRQPRFGSSLGGASIQFQCLVHPGPVQLRPDNGVSTVTTKP